MLDLHAAVHHDVEPRVAGDARRLVVADAELHPQHLRADGDRLARQRRHLAGLAEAVDDVDRLGDRGNARIAVLAQHLGVAGIDRDDPVAVLLQVLGREVARPVPVGRQADHGDRPRLREDAAQARDVVDDRHVSSDGPRRGATRRQRAKQACGSFHPSARTCGRPRTTPAPRVRVLVGDAPSRRDAVVERPGKRGIVPGAERPALAVEAGVAAEHPVAPLDAQRRRAIADAAIREVADEVTGKRHGASAEVRELVEHDAHASAPTRAGGQRQPGKGWRRPGRGRQQRAQRAHVPGELAEVGVATRFEDAAGAAIAVVLAELPVAGADLHRARAVVEASHAVGGSGDRDAAAGEARPLVEHDAADRHAGGRRGPGNLARRADPPGQSHPHR